MPTNVRSAETTTGTGTIATAVIAKVSPRVTIGIGNANAKDHFAGCDNVCFYAT